MALLSNMGFAALWIHKLELATVAEAPLGTATTKSQVVPVMLNTTSMSFWNDSKEKYSFCPFGGGTPAVPSGCGAGLGTCGTWPYVRSKSSYC